MLPKFYMTDTTTASDSGYAWRVTRGVLVADNEAAFPNYPLRTTATTTLPMASPHALVTLSHVPPLLHLHSHPFLRVDFIPPQSVESNSQHPSTHPNLDRRPLLYHFDIDNLPSRHTHSTRGHHSMMMRYFTYSRFISLSFERRTGPHLMPDYGSHIDWAWLRCWGR